MTMTPGKNTHPDQSSTNSHYCTMTNLEDSDIQEYNERLMGSWVFITCHPCLYFLFQTRQLTDHGITSFQKERTNAKWLPTVDSSIRRLITREIYLDDPSKHVVICCHSGGPYKTSYTTTNQWIYHIRKKHIGLPTNDKNMRINYEN